LKKEYITATQHVGTLRDAILFALKANAQHGLRRTNEDKRKAVMILLQDDEWKCLSSEQIAEKAAVSKMTVTRIKKELSINNDVIGKDGKIYKNITLNNELIEAKKYYIVKFDMEIKAVINDLINISKKNENALMLEAIEYLINKYNKPNN